jgi:hypothetical protein
MKPLSTAPSPLVRMMVAGASAALLCAIFPSFARAGVVLTVEAPGVQSSQVGGVTTETFDGITRANYTSLTTAVGTITAPAPGPRVHVANEFGGAGGTGNFLVVGSEAGQIESKQADLAFGGDEAYLGLWLSALDSQNQIQLFSGSTLIAFYNAPVVHAQLVNTAYDGNPNPAFLGQDPTEPFAYLNFIGTDGTTFDRVRFTDTFGTSGLEVDNISIRAAAIGGTLPGQPIIGGISVPEPASVSLLTAGCVALLARSRRRR